MVVLMLCKGQGSKALIQHALQSPGDLQIVFHGCGLVFTSVFVAAATVTQTSWGYRFESLKMIRV